ncbi:hypothetical protein H696_03972 [Fonticula alba]|uniref:PFU domain-containing protein n=1 Tax=Fonticula alba TaxID=691883 RepID=A0A058Z624_FONAL|nr:hypothetical protein H696_03972 [Fonticula alba]KCV69551.1 hypothetical protein H696_03972 [Fonticula alba]|eukprot:XP_009496116.1 hypothetical protein H696_03972 [Fonticula alba]
MPSDFLAPHHLEFLQPVTTLEGHSDDIKSLAVLPDGRLVSGSRDASVRIWPKACSLAGAEPNMTDTTEDPVILRHHTRFVNAVAVVPPSQQFPEGLLATAGIDNEILVYDVGLLQPGASGDACSPTWRLRGHTSNVCSLSAAVSESGDRAWLVSTSWDETARIWDMTTGVSLFVLGEPHTMAVWGALIFPEEDTVVTCGGDRNIYAWSLETGQVKYSLEGVHQDCIRGLSKLPGGSVLGPGPAFVSASNDGQLHVWVGPTFSPTPVVSSPVGTPAPENQRPLSLIYSTTVLRVTPDHMVLASSGEDRTVRVWKLARTGGALSLRQTQAIPLPGLSVWACVALAGPPAVTGEKPLLLAAAGSDLCVRVFSSEAPAVGTSSQEKYESALSISAVPRGLYGSTDGAAASVEQLPSATGPDCVRFVRDPANPENTHAYQWINHQSKWLNIGRVDAGESGGAGGASTSKVPFEGQLYDFVFDVDAEDDAPPKKLPYNLGDCPYMAAQRFLDTHLLPQSYLEQVVQFILNNATGAREALSSESSSNAYSDPYTGAGRYRPSMDSTPSASFGHGGAAASADPLTGAGRYVPDAPGPAAATAKPVKKSLPEPVLLAQSSAKRAIDTIRAWQASSSPDDSMTYEELTLIASLEGPLDSSTSFQLTQSVLFCIYKALLHAPPGVVFGVLDLISLISARNTQLPAVWQSSGIPDALVDALVTCSLLNKSPAHAAENGISPGDRMRCAIMGCRALVNVLGTADPATGTAVASQLTSDLFYECISRLPEQVVATPAGAGSFAALCLNAARFVAYMPSNAKRAALAGSLADACLTLIPADEILDTPAGQLQPGQLQAISAGETALRAMAVLTGLAPGPTDPEEGVCGLGWIDRVSQLAHHQASAPGVELPGRQRVSAAARQVLVASEGALAGGH